MSKLPMIAIVDDDQAVRDALCDLLLVEGMTARSFASAADFLAEDVCAFNCLITDVRMPEINGLVLQQRLRARGSKLPVIFITSSANDATRAEAMRGGASAWFTKPVADDALLGMLRTLAPSSRRGAQDSSGE